MTTFVTMILAAAVWSASQTPDDELRARAERLHREAIVLDTHADLTPFIEKDTKPVEITDPSLAGDAYDPKSDSLHAEIKTPLSVFIDHIAHAIEVAGADHVGLGLDYGYDAPAPEGLEHIGKLGAVTCELLKRGYDEETVRKVLGENTLRVMAEVERTAKRLNERR